MNTYNKYVYNCAFAPDTFCPENIQLQHWASLCYPIYIYKLLFYVCFTTFCTLSYIFCSLGGHAGRVQHLTYWIVMCFLVFMGARIRYTYIFVEE